MMIAMNTILIKIMITMMAMIGILISMMIMIAVVMMNAWRW
jgi:hypothetical protein